jgi:uncharacterized surface protein with fasciclin (FAS1) repeats
VKLLALVSAAVLSVGAAACSDDPSDAVNNDPAAANATTTSTTEAPVVMPKADIVGTALENGVFTQLAGLVVDAGLVDTLRGEGPFTVFAPTDDAFPAALTPVLDVLHQPENLKLLQAVLTYHVVPGRLAPADIKDGELVTVQGEKLTVTHNGDKLVINGNEVAAGPVDATNGNVYVMGAVLVPPSMMSTVQDILAKAATAGTAAAGTSADTTKTTG